jgi:hypothetical protein
VQVNLNRPWMPDIRVEALRALDEMALAMRLPVAAPLASFREKLGPTPAAATPAASPRGSLGPTPAAATPAASPRGSLGPTAASPRGSLGPTAAAATPAASPRDRPGASTTLAGPVSPLESTRPTSPVAQGTTAGASESVQEGKIPASGACDCASLVRFVWPGHCDGVQWGGGGAWA